MKTIATKKAPAAIGPYVQGVVAGGFLFASGQIALDPQTGELVGKTVEEQSEQVMRNKVYARSFEDHLPARSAVVVERLPKGALVEVKFIAKVGE